MIQQWMVDIQRVPRIRAGFIPIQLMIEGTMGQVTKTETKEQMIAW